MRRTALYREGIGELAALVAAQPDGEVCMLCAEEDPAHCHRTLLIAPDLIARGIAIVDIRKAGKD